MTVFGGGVKKASRQSLFGAPLAPDGTEKVWKNYFIIVQGASNHRESRPRLPDGFPSLQSLRRNRRTYRTRTGSTNGLLSLLFDFCKRQKGTGHFCPFIDILSEICEESNNKTTYLPLSLRTPYQKIPPKDITHLLYATTSKDKIGIRHLPRDDARHQSPEHLRRQGGLQPFHSHFKFPSIRKK